MSASTQSTWKEEVIVSIVSMTIIAFVIVFSLGVVKLYEILLAKGWVH